MTPNSPPKRGYDDSWPPVRGDYMIGCPESGVAVVTLASQLTVEGAALFGPCKTENLGVEKIVANVISNCNIRFLLLCGAESKGHLPGNTILALHKNGIDGQGRIVGSKGAIPFIQNIPPEAVSRFQEQVQVIDRIGCEDKVLIGQLVEKYNSIAEPFAEEPFQVVKKRIKATALEAGEAGEGDLFLGSGAVMDTSCWLVSMEG